MIKIYFEEQLRCLINVTSSFNTHVSNSQKQSDIVTYVCSVHEASCYGIYGVNYHYSSASSCFIGCRGYSSK